MKPHLFLISVVGLFLLNSCNDKKPSIADKKVQEAFVDLIKQESQGEFSTQEDEEEKLDRKIFGKKRRVKLDEVKSPTQQDTVRHPEWLTNKTYVTSFDAAKYRPSVLLGSIVKRVSDNEFSIFSLTQNVIKPGQSVEIEFLDQPTQFYEYTFTNNTRFNGDFFIGGITIEANQVLRTSYTETGFGLLDISQIDRESLRKIRAKLESDPDVNLSDWFILKGIVTVDCINTAYVETDFNADVNASWVSLDAGSYQKSERTNNYRLVSMDLEPLFLQ